MIRPQARRLPPARRRGAGIAVHALLSALALSAAVTAFPGAGLGAAGHAPPRVLLIVDQPDDLFAERIRAELAGLGLTVLTIEPWRTGAQVGPLESAARSERAVAAIRMVASRKGVEVWMADETSGRSLLRQLVVDESAGGPNQGLVALQTAELLRTSLLASSGPVPPPPPPAPPDVAPPSPEPEMDAGVQAAVGALASPGGAGAALQAWLTFHRAIGRRWGLALDLSAPVRRATVSGIEGSARVGTYLAGAAALLRLDAPGSGLYAGAGAGVAVVRVGVEGQTAIAMLTSGSDSAITGAGYLRADGGFEVARWFRFGARVVAGAALDRVAIHFAGNEGGSWGHVFGAALLLAELHWR